jgi:1-aminocyclopropane-1-carboxylate deaminase/D-cysteine desulfhydrase-like pyridoxal-dependent ACC family enzyme
MANQVYALLGIDKTVSPEDIIVYDQYYGEKYAVPTEAGNDAIRLLARTEAIVLDPVYTGKAMSGMIDMLRKGLLDDAEAVLFFHTGGYPAIFAYAEYFQE